MQTSGISALLHTYVHVYEKLAHTHTHPHAHAHAHAHTHTHTHTHTQIIISPIVHAKSFTKTGIFMYGLKTKYYIYKYIHKRIRTMIMRTMSLHDFVFDNKIYRQKEGGSIGLDLTGVVAYIYMGHWDNLLIKELEDHNVSVKLYKRYKDDINLILENSNSEYKQGEKGEFEQTTMNYIKSLADRIHRSIRVTGDIPSNYTDKRLPILDLKVWIGRTTVGECKIITSHYMKKVSSRAGDQQRVFALWEYEIECNGERNDEDFEEL